MIFQNGCSKDYILFKKKEKEICIFFQKKEKKEKEREISFQKKKKSFFLGPKSNSLKLHFNLILYERGTYAAFQRPGPNHPNNFRARSQNNVTKLFGCMLG